MAVTISTPQRVGSSLWLVSWISDLPDPTFYIYRDGALASVTQATSQYFSVAPGEMLDLAVVDSPSERTRTWPGGGILGWPCAPGAVTYEIQRWDGAAWRRSIIVQDTGTGFYRWRTPTLSDSTLHRYRVIPRDLAGNEGTPVEVEFLHVRRPDEPTERATYDQATGRLVVA